MFLYKIYCRIYQFLFKTVSPLLPWREPDLLEGAGSLKNLPAEMKKRGARTPLIVTDSGIAALGLLTPLEEELREQGMEWALFEGTVPNPTLANVEEGFRLYREKGCDSLIAFGGGSSMDCAKGIGIRVVRPGRSLASLKGVLKVRRRLPLLAAVPTTAGTGSEATLAAVLSNPESHEKYPINDHALIPRLAVLDPLLTVELPPSITATTGMDALTHAVEAYIGKSNTAETEADAVEAVRIIMQDLLPAYENGSDTARRGRLLKAAYLAGKAFTRAYVGYVHAVAHTLGGFYGVPHGLANSVILPHVLEYYGPAVQRRLAQLARKSGLMEEAGVAFESDAECAGHFITMIRHMNRRMGIPLTIDAIRESDIPEMAARALAEANPLYPVPVIYGKEEIVEIYKIINGKEKQ